MNTFMTEHYAITLFFITIGSLCIGSLLNVIIFRLPAMLMDEASTINLWWPRSFCPHCKHQIAAMYNIPLLSYCLLRGKCHYCKASINWRYPCVELLSVVLSLTAVYIFGISYILIFALLFVYYNICIIFIDLKEQIIPDSLSLGLLWLGLIANTQNMFTTLPIAVWSAFSAYLFLWLLIKIYALITNKIGMGNGDFKLFAAFGAWFGITALPWVLLISSLLGTIIGISYLKMTRQGKDTQIPFGPFLSIAGLLILFSNNPF